MLDVAPPEVVGVVLPEVTPLEVEVEGPGVGLPVSPWGTDIKPESLGRVILGRPVETVSVSEHISIPAVSAMYRNLWPGLGAERERFPHLK